MEVTLEVIPKEWWDIKWTGEEYWQHGMSASLLLNRHSRRKWSPCSFYRQASSLGDSNETSSLFCFGCGGNTFSRTERVSSKSTLSIPQGLLHPCLQLCLFSSPVFHTHTHTHTHTHVHTPGGTVVLTKDKTTHLLSTYLGPGTFLAIYTYAGI